MTPEAQPRPDGGGTRSHGCGDDEVDLDYRNGDTRVEHRHSEITMSPYDLSNATGPETIDPSEAPWPGAEVAHSPPSAPR